MTLKKTKFDLIVIAFLLLLGFSGITEDLDLRSSDVFRRRLVPHPDIVILAIDNQSLQTVGRWPWDRKTHAAIVNQLNDYQPRVLGIDVAFFEPQNQENDELLQKSLENASFPVVLAAEAINFNDGSQKILLPLAEFRQTPNISLGHVNVQLASDGQARLIPGILTSDGQVVVPLVSALARVLQAEELPTDNYGVNFIGPAGSFPTYSLAALIKGQISLERLQDKIILIGATASDLHDLLPVPLTGKFLSGIEWQANVLDNILLKRPLTLTPSSLYLTLGVLTAVVLILFFYYLRPGVAFSLTALAALAWPVVSYAFYQSESLLPYFFPVLNVAVVFIYEGFYRWLRAEIEKRKLRRTFQNYFSPQVMEKILKDPAALKLGGERKEITILFSDIRSFTTITEKIPPEMLSLLLHEYFTEMTAEILATDGVLDKFIGDAIMAFWGAPIDQPDQADRAVQAALGMMGRLKKLQSQWQERGWPVIDIGIGIHSGLATVGNLGSEKRFDYTAIGDSVNAASRLEGLNKEYKTHIIISAATKSKLTAKINARPLAEVLVKGKSLPIKIFSVYN